MGYSQKSDRKSEEAIEQTGPIATDNKNVRFIQKKKKKTTCLTTVITSVRTHFWESQRNISNSNTR